MFLRTKDWKEDFDLLREREVTRVPFSLLDEEGAPSLRKHIEAVRREGGRERGREEGEGGRVGRGGGRGREEREKHERCVSVVGMACGWFCALVAATSTHSTPTTTLRWWIEMAGFVRPWFEGLHLYSTCTCVFTHTRPSPSLPPSFLLSLPPSLPLSLPPFLPPVASSTKRGRSL